MSSEQQPEATIVVPTRHEEESVGPLLKRIHHAFADRHGHVEVLFVDDSDNPRTVAAIHRATQELRSRKLVVGHIHRTGGERRGGLAGAVIDGIARASSSYILVMDGDGQHPPETAPEMIDKVRNGTDIVVASRYRPGGSADGLDSYSRKVVSRAATFASRTLFPRSLAEVTDPMTGFFAVKRDKLNMERLRNSKGFKILLEILALHPHLKRDEVPLQFQERIDGQSKAGEGNGAEFLRQLPRLRLTTLPSFISFLAGGGAIAAVGALLLWMLVHLGVKPQAAFGVQLVITVVLNFIYNKRITWHGHTNGSLRRQMTAFAVTRTVTLVLSWVSFPLILVWLTGHNPFGASLAVRVQVANAVCLVGSTVLNFFTSKMVFEERHAIGVSRHRRRWYTSKTLGVVLAVGGVMLAAIWSMGFLNWLVTMTLIFAAFSLVTASLELRWRLYGRRTPEASEAMRFPAPVAPHETTCTFSVIVPALDEPAVIQATLRRLLGQTHPNVQIVVSLVEGDSQTIDKVKELIAEYGDRLVLVTKDYGQSSKPKQLNEALFSQCSGDYVGVVDAETVEPEELLVHIEAVIRETGADVVQGGVQLVNLDIPRLQSWDRLQRLPRLQRVLRPFFMSGFWTAVRGWFAVHNVLEYFFWFSSRMFYQADQGFVPYAGNTLFIRRDLLMKAGGWPDSLTEDCALGVHLSVKYGAKVVAAYEPRLAAREETPSHIFGRGGLDRQRRRWVQGFIQVLLQGEWRELPTFHQRMMALYILAMPFVQAMNGVMLPVAIVSMLLLKVPEVLAMAMFLPLIPMLMTVVLQVLGLREFSRAFQQKARIRHYASLVCMNFAYQVVLAWSAIMAVKRQIAGEQNWEKTQHDGTHQQPQASAA